ncbi:beta-aspartyl-peptidase [Mangrovibacillus cuniculi]|uniref:Isoaspartyl dipeptidase n=1 Tax=Mangrovibacillus cuniculi TaxID=2593652 RepID=A0A7S8C9L7_9BACI|nr:beta-aspartyl-peptidase [Mangrovibacillus cuniculi]QPC45954.1 beta-aspartyl-peptidase [Mangrovibacillus cuniculi]
MLTYIKNGTVFAPEKVGAKEILVANGVIEEIDNKINMQATTLTTIDAEGLLIVPGFIDSHVHLIGGGGEGGYATRTPEASLTDFTRYGITTAVGVIGTDGITRTMPSLLAKARGLTEEGMTCYIHTGSYQIPVKTLTDSIEKDLLFVPEIIGVGEIAIADHRSSQPTMEELIKVTAEARVAGMLSGKAGIVNIHLGDAPDGFELLWNIVKNSPIPITQFHPTHINRNRSLFEDAMEFAKQGGVVDFTTSTVPTFLEEGEVACSKGLAEMLSKDVPISQITFTSDGQASLPHFSKKGELLGLQIGKMHSLYEAVKEAVLNEGVPLEIAIQVITSNPARHLKLAQKGQLTTGYHADMVFLDETTLEIRGVMAKGIVHMWNGQMKQKGTFEK